MRRAEWIPPVVGAAGLTLVGVVEILLDPSFRTAPLAPAAVLVLVILGTLVAVRAPILGTAIVALQFPLAAALGLDGPTGAGVLAFFLLPAWAGWRRPPRVSWIAPLAAQLLATAGAALGAMAGAASGTASDPSSVDLAAVAWENLYFSAIAWVSWMVGAFARGAGDRAARAERLAEALDAEREARERTILVEERQRIARDLHDSVAHSVSVMTLQIGALRTTLPAGSSEAEMLKGIERLGRESVAELRSAVGILRESEPAEAAPPSLARASELVDDARATGLDVSFTQEGDFAGLSRATDVSAFRVLQESLTNVLRHAPGSTARVRLARDPRSLVVEVENTDAAAPPSPARSGGGHGLVGMHERLALAGGGFSAGPTARGGWRVRAEFPVEEIA
ncbi:sensor histidine kinase [Microbacterium sp. SS28]|uniref:sensor histidine kinase n=1 Tax=Microbacterium sp. SS28 TaxID=2919948 RepID=UPI001FAADBEB|nr:histidine kinase [Microbacterium sp. SS28]